MATIDLSILNSTVNAFLDIGQSVFNRIDVVIGIALIGIVVGVATNMGKGLGGLFSNIFKKS